MRSTSIFATAGFLAAQLANAQSLAPLWYQCGGIYYKGPIECEPPGICVYIDPTYSQCQPKDYFYSTSRVGTVKPTGTAVTITKTETVTVTSTLPCTTISTRCISSTPVPTSSTRPPVSSPYSSTKPTVTSLSTDKPSSSTRPTVITSSTRPPVTSTLTSTKPTITTKPTTTYKSSTSSTKTCTSTTTKPTPTWGGPVICPIDGIKPYKFLLTQSADGKAILAEKAETYDFEFAADQIYGGPFIIKPWPPRDPCNPIRWYLSIDEAYPFSYKPLYFTDSPKTDYWFAAPGKEVTTADRSPFGTQGTFLVCGDQWELYLQTGDEVPKDVYCEKTTLLFLE